MKEEIKTSILNTGFLLSFIFMLQCFLGQSIYTWIIALPEPWEFKPSALVQTIQAIFFGGVILLFPFCACAPCASCQVTEIKTNAFQRRLDSGLKGYAAQKIVANALSGALAVSLAFVIHTILWNIIALPVDPETYPTHELHFYGVYDIWYRTLRGLPMYLSVTLGMMVCGSVFATIALATAVWLPDKTLVMAIPAGFYYLWIKVVGLAPDTSFPRPADLFNDALTYEGIVYSLITYAVLFIMVVVLYMAGLKRRVKLYA